MPPCDHFTPVILLRAVRHGGLGIVRSLGRLGIPVYAVETGHSVPAALSRYCRRRLDWDFAGSSAQQTVNFLVNEARSIRPRPILLPTTDEAAVFVADHAEALEQSYILPGPSPECVRSLVSKASMFRLAKRLGIPTANTIVPQSRRDVLAFVETASFPAVLKPVAAGMSNGAVRATYIAGSRDELLRQYDRMRDPARPNLILQEYIPGGENSVWMFNGYFDSGSNCLFGMTGRKLRQCPAYTGAACLAVCLRNDLVYEMTLRFMKAIGYSGILDIGFRYDARDGQYKVLDVNPRIGSTFRLFVGQDGMDVARAMYLDLTGQAVPASERSEGRKWIVEDCDLVSSVRYYLDGHLTIGEWVRSLAGIREAAWLCADDPVPAVAALACDLRSLAARVSGRTCFSGFPRFAGRPRAPGSALAPELRAVSGSGSAGHAPRIREAYFSDYPMIAELLRRNGLAIRSYEDWEALWTANPAYIESWPIGWVLETGRGEIVGSIANIPLAYAFRGKTLTAAAACSWAVDPPYRRYSMLMLDRLMRQPNVDLLISSTVSANAEPAYRVFQWARMPAGPWDRSWFWITNYAAFSRSALIAKAVPLPRLLSRPLSCALFAWDSLRRLGAPGNRDARMWNLELCPRFDNRFDVFWEKLKDQNRGALLAARSQAELCWHFRHALRRETAWIVTASSNSDLLAYGIFDRLDNDGCGLKRVRLVDYQALAGGEEAFQSVLAWALQRCRREGLHVLEIAGGWFRRLGRLPAPAPHARTLPSWTCYYRAVDKELADALERPGVWAPSAFDGDASI